MVVTTKAIVLNSIKYNDTSLIVRCFTLTDGVKSYLLRGVLKSKKANVKAAYFQPLTLLEITANHTNKATLNSIKEVRLSSAYETLQVDFVKQTITFFLAEFLNSVLKEEEENEELFSFVATSLQWLDLHSGIANFHLVFLVKLTKYLGFYPDNSEKENSYFNLVEGRFSSQNLSKNFIFGEDLKLFKKLLGINFDTIETLSLNVLGRQRLLQIIIEYYKLQMDSFKKPKSIQVLKELF